MTEINYPDFATIHKRKNDFRQMKQAIWVYFILLIFEGSLRKWIFPGLSDILLIVRDPVALFILFKAFQQKLFQNNVYLFGMTVISVIAFFTTFYYGHGNIVVALYGLRIMILHFPLIFVIGKVFTRGDVIRLGKITLWLALPMVVLIGIQFYSPQSALVNRGIAGNIEGAGFSGANGYFRPPGTFSFTSGNSMFWGLVSAYLLYFWLKGKEVKKGILILVSASLFGAMSFSISRTLFFEICLTMAFAFIATWNKPKYFTRMLIVTASAILLILLLSEFHVFHTGIEAFTSRFVDAGDSEGGLKGTLGNRFMGGMIDAISTTSHLSFWGKGLGMGTNAGAKMMTGSANFLISEGEWGRLIGEMGFYLGLGAILIRTILSLNLFRNSYSKLSTGDPLPWMLLSFGFINIMQGQWAQPTFLGFGVLTGGLIMASLKKVRNRNIPSITQHRSVQ